MTETEFLHNQEENGGLNQSASRFTEVTPLTCPEDDAQLLTSLVRGCDTTSQVHDDYDTESCVQYRGTLGECRVESRPHAGEG